jgi:hypothetical protein
MGPDARTKKQINMVVYQLYQGGTYDSRRLKWVYELTRTLHR